MTTKKKEPWRQVKTAFDTFLRFFLCLEARLVYNSYTSRLEKIFTWPLNIGLRSRSSMIVIRAQKYRGKTIPSQRKVFSNNWSTWTIAWTVYAYMYTCYLSKLRSCWIWTLIDPPNLFHFGKIIITFFILVTSKHVFHEPVAYITGSCGPAYNHICPRLFSILLKTVNCTRKDSMLPTQSFVDCYKAVLSVQNFTGYHLKTYWTRSHNEGCATSAVAQLDCYY